MELLNIIRLSSCSSLEQLKQIRYVLNKRISELEQEISSRMCKEIIPLIISSHSYDEEIAMLKQERIGLVYKHEDLRWLIFSHLHSCEIFREKEDAECYFLISGYSPFEKEDPVIDSIKETIFYKISQRLKEKYEELDSILDSINQDIKLIDYGKILY